MDFVDWCGGVLNKLIQMIEDCPEARMLGYISLESLAEWMFGHKISAQQFFRESEHGKALIGAVEALASITLINTKKAGSTIHIEVNQRGRAYAADPVPIWEEICKAQLNGEQEQLLRFVNQLSPRRGENFAWLEWVSRETVAASEWGNEDRFIPAERELERLSFVRSAPGFGPELDLKATYQGLVWETKPPLIQKLKSKKEGVFISHINEESGVAHRVKSLLQETFGPELKVFVSSDYESLRGGDKWFSTILENLKSAKVILVLLSKDSLYRPWIPYEAGVGEGAGAKVIPMVHMDFSLRELGPPLGEYHVRRLQSADGVRALIKDVKIEIGAEPSEVDVGEFVDAVKALGREAAYRVNEPGRELVRTWIETVITPIIRMSENEQQLLDEQRLKWDDQWDRVKGIGGIRDNPDPTWRDRLEQFEKFYPDVRKAIDEHDREAATLQEQYQHLLKSTQESPELRALYERAVSPESLAEMGTNLREIFNIEDVTAHLKAIAEHIISRDKRLSRNYTTRRLWERYGSEFVDILDRPSLKGPVGEAEAIAGRLLQIVKQLISRLKEIREALSLKHNVSY